MKKILFVLMVLLSVSVYAEDKNGVVYVKSGASGSGVSWEDALGDIQEAITVARENNDARKDVWVAGGEYVISTCIGMQDSINVYGSFAGTEAALAERKQVAGGQPWEFVTPTILKADNSRLVETVSNFDVLTVFDGFVLTGGNGVGKSWNGNGGGAVVRTNMALQNCIVKECSLNNGAGGGINTNGGVIQNCWIYKNRQEVKANGGGGIYVNTAADKETLIENCKIERNTSTVRGGGINVQGKGFTTMKNLYIVNNKAEAAGMPKGGGAIYGNSPNYVVMNSIIANNSGKSSLYIKGSFLNNTIVNNVGGAYIAEGSAQLEISNNIFWGLVTDYTGETATALSGKDNSNAIVHNNATYNPLPEGKWSAADNIRFSSNVSNGDIEEYAEGTVGSGAKFRKPTRFKGVAAADEEILQLDSADWRLNYNSPCLNVGKKLDAVTHDYLYIARPQGYPVADAKFDMGAYELPYHKVVVGEGVNKHGAIYDNTPSQVQDGSEKGYAEGSLAEYFFTVAEGFQLSKAYYVESEDGGLTFEGKEVKFTKDIDEDGIWTSKPLMTSIKIFVEYKSVSALEDIDLYYNVYSKNGQVVMVGLENNATISIYNLTGATVYHQKADAQIISVPLSKGIYVIRINDKSKKIIVD